MMDAILSAFVSIAYEPPCFVIPVFAVAGSNFSFAQDLALDGKLNKFLKIDSQRFNRVPIIPASLRVSDGDEGIIAFWFDSDTVIYGVTDSVRNYILKIDDNTLPAFVAVEAMTLLGDDARLEFAASRAANLIKRPDAAKSYSTKIVSRSSYIKSLIRRAGDEKVAIPEFSIKELIERLRLIQNDFEWQQEWRSGWMRLKYPSELFGLLRWKIDTGLNIEYQAYCLCALVLPKNEIYGRYAEDWLVSNITSGSMWISVWNSLYPNRQDHKVSLLNLGLNFMEAQTNVDQRHYFADHQWSVFWNRLWREKFAPDQLIEIAQWTSSRPMRDTDSFVRFVIQPIINIHNHAKWTDNFLLNWLSSAQGNGTWVKAYVDMSSRFSDNSDYRQAGIEWLGRLGSGMNLWVVLWHDVRKNIEDELAISLALDWLNRSRKDLSLWPDMFRAVFELLGNRVVPLLVTAAQRWTEASQGKNRSNQLIQMIADDHGSVDGIR